MGSANSRIFGTIQQNIKPYNGTFVAVEGANITHKLTAMPQMRVPFQQVLTGRITLRAGQTNYLLNHLGMGDNATFLALTAQYSEKSKFESDNYVQWSYFSNKGKLFNFAQMMVLTGNSENRIEQLYLHNPNQNEAVVIEVMVAVVDEFYNFFDEVVDTTTANSITFSNLKHTDLEIWESDDSIMVVNNDFGQPVAYINLGDINSVTVDGKIVTIDDESIGQILLVFCDEYNATQARVKISNWVDTFNNNEITPPPDDFEPIITFTTNVIDDDVAIPYGGSLTSLDGDRSFLALALDLSDYSNVITKTILSNFIISKVEDFQANMVAVNPSTDLIIKTESGSILTQILVTGEYYVFFDISDSVGNKVDSNVNVKINVI